MNFEIQGNGSVVARGRWGKTAYMKWIGLAAVFFSCAWSAAAQSGAISLTVDATQTPLKVIRTQETIPV
ncbi:MAG TPA: hypothetical protein VFI75_02315, partial [Candidatus Acidoferrum sp.]|nr:hypothetical protein [Candidatus Acidoferrum sp.]